MLDIKVEKEGPFYRLAVEMDGFVDGTVTMETKLLDEKKARGLACKLIGAAADLLTDVHGIKMGKLKIMEKELRELNDE